MNKIFWTSLGSRDKMWTMMLLVMSLDVRHIANATLYTGFAKYTCEVGAANHMLLHVYALNIHVSART